MADDTSSTGRPTHPRAWTAEAAARVAPLMTGRTLDNYDCDDALNKTRDALGALMPEATIADAVSAYSALVDAVNRSSLPDAAPERLALLAMEDVLREFISTAFGTCQTDAVARLDFLAEHVLGEGISECESAIVHVAKCDVGALSEGRAGKADLSMAAMRSYRLGDWRRPGMRGQ